MAASVSSSSQSRPFMQPITSKLTHLPVDIIMVQLKYLQKKIKAKSTIIQLTSIDVASAQHQSLYN